MMDVDNCDVQPCRVFHRTTIKMTTQLSSPINSSSAEWEIRAFVNGRPYGHPEPVSDACLFVNSTSPNAFSSSHRTPLNSDQFKSGPSTAYRQKSFLPMCPLFAGKIYRFSNVFYVHDQFPKVATTIQYLLRGDNDEMIACARLHILMSS
ncbi:uncharacterized protein LOC111270432 isoform X2 [Varroa jacobsoni]|nr:uncharacterized protein LOC111270432 isoform X2 [Varroa jacobsoni]